jgi:hypothetical protein
VQVIEPWCKLLKAREIVLALRQNANSFAKDVSLACGNNCHCQVRFRPQEGPSSAAVEREFQAGGEGSYLHTYLYVHCSLTLKIKGSRGRIPLPTQRQHPKQLTASSNVQLK